MSKKILITHQKGGVGKSTLTFNLAQNLCNNCKVAVLDIDLQGSLAQLRNTVSDFKITTDKCILNSEEEFDFVFIDTPPYLSEELEELVVAADLIIVPTKAGILDVLAIQNTIEIIKTAKKQNRTLVVFNMVKPNTTLTNHIVKALEPFEISIAHTKISDLVAFTRSVVFQGIGKANKAQRQLDNLTKEILTLLI